MSQVHSPRIVDGRVVVDRRVRVVDHVGRVTCSWLTPDGSDGRDHGHSLRLSARARERTRDPSFLLRIGMPLQESRCLMSRRARAAVATLWHAMFRILGRRSIARTSVQKRGAMCLPVATSCTPAEKVPGRQSPHDGSQHSEERRQVRYIEARVVAGILLRRRAVGRRQGCDPDDRS